MTRRWLAVILLAVAATAAQAQCLDGRYRVPDAPLLPGASGDGDTVVIAAGTVAIASGCPAVPAARIRRTGRGTLVRARWLQCGTVARVRLRLRVTPDCTAADGRFVTRRPPSLRRFVATTGLGCDGFAGIPCPDRFYCQHPAGTCGVVDQQGVCMAVPEACPDVWDPVCGCDGTTYSNDCDRQAAQAQKAHDGPCGAPCEVPCDCYRQAPLPIWCDALACPACGCVWTCEKGTCATQIVSPVPDPGCGP